MRGSARNLGGLAATAAACGALLVPASSVAATTQAAYPPASGGDGGAGYATVVAPAGRPVAAVLQVTPSQVTAGRALPSLRVRIDERGVSTVAARIVVWPAQGRGTAVRLDLGRVRTGRTVAAAWPTGTALAAGSYTVLVHATDPAGRPLSRPPHASGRAALVVRAAPVTTITAPPAAAPALTRPVTSTTPTPTAEQRAGSVLPGGTFPVAGPHTFGDGFGVPRGDHFHQGVDILAAQGLPVVAPLAGTVTQTSYQASAAGEYVVMAFADGRSGFFAHCLRDSTAVKAGQSVAQGTELCLVGQTGDATTPHLHFELWPHGWRTGGPDSIPVDPRPQLDAWDR